MLLAVMTATTVLFTSCKDDKDDDEILNVPPDSIVVDGAKKLDMGDYSFSFSANKDGEFTWKGGTYTGEYEIFNYWDIVFETFAVYDSTDRLVRLSLYEQVEEQAGRYTVANLDDVLGKYFYGDDVPGMKSWKREANAKLGSTDAVKYTSVRQYVDEKGNPYGMEMYSEQYVVFIPKSKKLLVVTMELPMEVKDKRINEMHNILKSFRLK